MPTHLATPSSSPGASTPAQPLASIERSIELDAERAARRPAAEPPSPPESAQRDRTPRVPRMLWRPAAVWTLAGLLLLAIGVIAWPLRASLAGGRDAATGAAASAATPGAAPSPTASAGAAAPLVVAPSAGSYAVRASLYRQVNDGKVDLQAGDRVGPGDDLGLRLWSTQPLYTYVVNRDERGEAYLLFPIKGYELQNPLPPGQHELPGGREGTDQFWEVTSRGGEEHFLVFADTAPMPEFDELLRQLPAPEPGRPVRYAAVPRALVGALRGVGGVTPARQGRSTRMNALFASAKPLAREAETVSGPWLRLISFKNPVE